MNHDGHRVHARCFEAGEHLIGLTAAILAEPQGAPFCVRCLATDLGTGELEIRSALWHVARTIRVARGTCGCGAGGWRLTSETSSAREPV
jgi:hypothetical protein